MATDVVTAAKEMKRYVACSMRELPDVKGGEATSCNHLFDMIAAIENKEVTGEKAHRWLGWIQGVVCCRGGASLDEMKEVNK